MRKGAMLRFVFWVLLLAGMTVSCKMANDGTNGGADATGPADGNYGDGTSFYLTVSGGKVVHFTCTLSQQLTTVKIDANVSWAISDNKISAQTVPASSLGNMTILGSFSGTTVTLTYSLSEGGTGQLTGSLGTNNIDSTIAPTVTIKVLEKNDNFARVSLSYTASMNASIYYSIDGSAITTSSLSYSPGQEIVIAKNCTLKAAAYGYSFGETASQDFSFPVVTSAPSGTAWARTFGVADISETGSELIAMADGKFLLASYGQASTLDSGFAYQGTHNVTLPEGTPWVCYYIHRAPDGRVFKVFYKFNTVDYNKPVPLAIVGYGTDGSQTFARQYSIQRINPATIWYYRPGAFVSNADGSFALAFSHNTGDSGGNRIALLECAADGSPSSFTLYNSPEDCVSVTSLSKVGSEYVLIAEEQRGGINVSLTLQVARISVADHSVIKWVQIPVDILPGNFDPSSAKWYPGSGGAGILFYSSDHDNIAAVLSLDSDLKVTASWFWKSVYAPVSTQLASGDIIVGGAWRSYEGSYDSDLAMIRLKSADLTQVWAKRYGGAYAESFDGGSLLALSGGGFLASGETYSFGCGKYDQWLLRVPDNGGDSSSTAALNWGVDFTPAATTVSAPVSTDVANTVTSEILSTAGLLSDMDPAPAFTDSSVTLVNMSQL